jgi:hypothetical protein
MLFYKLGNNMQIMKYKVLYKNEMNKKTKTTVAVAVIKTSQQYIYFTVPSID